MKVGIQRGKGRHRASHHQNGRCVTPSTSPPPPPPATHSADVTRVCPHVVEWAICWRRTSQIRLHKVLHTRDYLSLTLCSPSAAPLFWGLLGISWQRVGVLPRGGVVADWTWFQLGQTGSASHQISDRKTPAFRLCDRHQESREFDSLSDHNFWGWGFFFPLDGGAVKIIFLGKALSAVASAQHITCLKNPESVFYY